MPEININYEIYLPTPSVYFSYFELLKSHQFIKNEKDSQMLFDMFLDNFLDDLENFEEPK